MEGLWVHSTLALTPDGVVQGVLAREQWTQPVGERGVAARRRDRAIAEKASRKWLGGLDATNTAARSCPTTHWIAEGDRACDIDDVFRRAREPNVDLVVRAAQDRALVDDPDAEAEATRLLRARVAARPVGGRTPWRCGGRRHGPRARPRSRCAGRAWRCGRPAHGPTTLCQR